MFIDGGNDDWSHVSTRTHMHTFTQTKPTLSSERYITKCRSRTGKTKHNVSAKELFLLLLGAVLEDEAMQRCTFLGETEWSQRIRTRPITYETLYWCYVWFSVHSVWNLSLCGTSASLQASVHGALGACWWKHGYTQYYSSWSHKEVEDVFALRKLYIKIFSILLSIIGHRCAGHFQVKSMSRLFYFTILLLIFALNWRKFQRTLHIAPWLSFININWMLCYAAFQRQSAVSATQDLDLYRHLKSFTCIILVCELQSNHQCGWLSQLCFSEFTFSLLVLLLKSLIWKSMSPGAGLHMKRIKHMREPHCKKWLINLKINL